MFLRKTHRPTGWRLGSCPACGGDLYQEGLDEDWFTCLMCARSFQVEQLLALDGSHQDARLAGAGESTAAVEQHAAA